MSGTDLDRLLAAGDALADAAAVPFAIRAAECGCKECKDALAILHAYRAASRETRKVRKEKGDETTG